MCSPVATRLMISRIHTITLTVIILIFNSTNREQMVGRPVHTYSTIDSCNILQIIDNVSLSWSWHFCYSLPACSKQTEILCLIHMWHHRQQGDILLWEAESLPSDPGWTDSPAGTPTVSCVIMSPVPATCPVGFSALHKGLPVRLSNQRHGCVIYLIMGVPQTGFSCTYSIFHLL